MPCEYFAKRENIPNQVYSTRRHGKDYVASIHHRSVFDEAFSKARTNELVYDSQFVEDGVKTLMVRTSLPIHRQGRDRDGARALVNLRSLSIYRELPSNE